jgi:hypothetical protein
VINVRIAYAEPRVGPVVQPRGLHQRGFVVVLADDVGQRALPVWVAEEPGVVELPDLLNRPDDDIWTTAGIPEELAARLLDAAGASVTGVDIQPVTKDPDEVNAGTCAARVALGAARVTARLDLGLTLAVVSGAPVRVDDALMDRLAVAVPADDPAAPFREPRPPMPRGRVIVEVSTSKRRVLDVPGAAFPWGRPRFEPRNLDFAAGLAGWQLHGPDDYSATVEDSTAILAPVVAEPSDRATLVQTIFADDFSGTRVTFRGEFRTDGVTDQAGLCLRIPMKGDPDLPQERLVTVSGSRDWTSDAITMDVPEGADVIQFGLVLTGRGRVQLRNPELCRNLTTLSWSTWPATATRWRSGCSSSGTSR